MNEENQAATRQCPFCAEQILVDAVKCKHCGEWLDGHAMGVQSMQGSDHIGNARPYLIVLFLGIGLLFLGVVVAAVNEDAGVALISFGAMSLFAAIVLFFVLFYQVWRFVINESGRNGLVASIETPGKAIGYCFIPFYNLYWVFQAFGKFPKDFNALARARGANSMMSEGLGTAIPVLVLVSIIPFIGYLTAFVNFFILYPLFITRAVRQCKELV